jgi:hypothetical protein
MRISEDRYSRDLRRIHVAQRMIGHEVRTQWIHAWTGLSAARIRNLYHSYVASLKGVARHRGPSPRRIAAFLRSPALRNEASAIGGLARVLEIIPKAPVRNARRNLPNLDLGERMCHVFELYQHIVPESTFTMDQFILLVITLAEADDLEIGHCTNCHGALLLDRLGHSRRLCPHCRQGSLNGSKEAASLGSSTPQGSDTPPDPAQGSLF